MHARQAAPGIMSAGIAISPEIREFQAYYPAMNKETGLDEHRAGDKFVHFIDWLNHKLVGTLGPPNLGPYTAVVERVGAALCPVCGRPMIEHAIDHSGSNAVLNCPVDHLPERVQDAKLNELGMPKHLP